MFFYLKELISENFDLFDLFRWFTFKQLYVAV